MAVSEYQDDKGPAQEEEAWQKGLAGLNGLLETLQAQSRVVVQSKSYRERTYQITFNGVMFANDDDAKEMVRLIKLLIAANFNLTLSGHLIRNEKEKMRIVEHVRELTPAELLRQAQLAAKARLEVPTEPVQSSAPEPTIQETAVVATPGSAELGLPDLAEDRVRGDPDLSDFDLDLGPRDGSKDVQLD